MVFLHSLNAIGYQGDLVLLVNRNTVIDRSAATFPVKLIHVDEGFSGSACVIQNIIDSRNFNRAINHRWIMSLGRISPVRHLKKIWKSFFFKKFGNELHERDGLSVGFRKYLLSNYYLATSRFVFYYNFLLHHRYDKVFFTDVSDVIFQDNIFDRYTDKGVFAYQECEGWKIGKDPNNSYWIRYGFGQKILKAMSERNIHCSGTIYATYDEALVFLKDYLDILLGTNLPGRLTGLDQGIYNYMLHYLAPKYFNKESNGRNVFTVGLVTSEQIEILDEAIYKAGEIIKPAVVHQYNRHPFLMEHVNRTKN